MSSLNPLHVSYKGDKEVTIASLIPEQYKFQYIRAETEGRLRELSFTVKSPCEIDLYGIDGDAESQYIYKNTMMYVTAMAIHRLYPERKFLFSNDVSRSIYIAPLNPDDTLTITMMIKIREEVDKIVKENLPIVKKLVTKAEAEAMYTKLGMEDKLAILEYKPEAMVHLYVCDGYTDYLYGYMCPSTGYLTSYNFIPRIPGFLVQFPRSEFGGKIPPFQSEPVFERTLVETRAWSKKVNLDTIAEINDFASAYGPTDFIMMCESHVTDQLSEIGEMVSTSPTKIKLICIAGPSSSGKTTFANRLRLQLLGRGLRPVRISCDDYYKERKDMVPMEDGSYDLESISAIDVDLFNDQMLRLSEGEEVTLPHLDFKTNRRVQGRTLKLDKDQPIIIEGIHALNERMTSLVAPHNKFKIFISPQAQINIDNHTPISLTDFRLIRRIVRDSKFRHASAEDTINMWPSVRNGEFKWIYQTQEEANYVFNSLLPYELCVMRKYALPALAAIPKKSAAYVYARRLVLFLKYFTDLDDKDVPNNSLIREFIGGSCFKDV